MAFEGVFSKVGKGADETESRTFDCMGKCGVSPFSSSHRVIDSSLQDGVTSP